MVHVNELQAASEEEVVAAFDAIQAHPDHFIFIEIVVSKHDACPGAAVMREGFLKKQAPRTMWTPNE